MSCLVSRVLLQSRHLLQSRYTASAAAVVHSSSSTTAESALSSNPVSVGNFQVPKMKSPQEMIAEVAIIEVEGLVARCDGAWHKGHPQLGHPVEFIQLNKRAKNTPEVCKYCGLRFMMKKGFFPTEH